MNTVTDTRYARFMALLSRYPNLKTMGLRLGLQPPHVSMLASGTRPVSDVVVKRISDKLGLPEGWFDDEGMPPRADEVNVGLPLVSGTPAEEQLRRHKFVLPKGRGTPHPADQALVSALMDLAPHLQQDRLVLDARYISPFGVVRFPVLVMLESCDLCITLLESPIDQGSGFTAEIDLVLTNAAKLSSASKQRTTEHVAVVAPKYEGQYKDAFIPTRLEAMLTSARDLRYLREYAHLDNLEPLKSVMML